MLKQIAGVLARNTRNSDVLARYGGDEFAVLMPGTGKEQTVKIMQRIENAVETFLFLKNIKISLSSGVVVFPAEGNSLNQLLAAADARMYAKKEAKFQHLSR